MRKAVTMGLLAAALIPLSLDQQSFGKNSAELPATVAEGDMAFHVLSLMLAANDDDTIRLALKGSSRAREWAALKDYKTGKRSTATIETASIRKSDAALAKFTIMRNVEIRRSMAAYRRAHDALTIATLNREIAQSMARAKAHREARFTTARNAEIRRSLAAYEAATDIRFAELRNAEARRSLAAYEAGRNARFADARNREIAESTARTDQARALAFKAARNAEAGLSLAAYEAATDIRFAELRNTEARRSMAAYEAGRNARFAEARNREIAESTARTDRARTLAFAAARNKEAIRSRVAYEGTRTQLIAEAYRRELARIAARYAEIEIAIARNRNESLISTLARIAPHMHAGQALAARPAGTSTIETASIEPGITIGPCAIPSP